MPAQRLITMKVRKKPQARQVSFAECDGLLQTLEGPVAYARGDALMQGVAGERWPLPRALFEQRYVAISPTQPGEAGWYLPHQEILHASRLAVPTEVALSEGRGTLRGQAGDWLIEDHGGARWLVAGRIFGQTYEIIEA